MEKMRQRTNHAAIMTTTGDVGKRGHFGWTTSA
jgi:hypothetical protein